MLVGISAIFAAGWVGSRFSSETWETALTLTGSVLLITSHYWNRSFCRLCRACHEGTSSEPAGLGKGCSSSR
jgi:hypothetical protein